MLSLNKRFLVTITKDTHQDYSQEYSGSFISIDYQKTKEF